MTVVSCLVLPPSVMRTAVRKDKVKSTQSLISTLNKSLASCNLDTFRKLMYEFFRYHSSQVKYLYSMTSMQFNFTSCKEEEKLFTVLKQSKYVLL